MKTTKTKKWWFCFTLTAAIVIATIITDMLYPNGLDKIIIFGFLSLGVGLLVLIGSKRVGLIVSLLIFCSSSFFVAAPTNKFTVFYRDGQMPVVLDNIRLAIPYSYDVVEFDRRQKLIIVDNNEKAIVDFELSKDSVLMIQHGFADQKDFAAAIQKRADSRFFEMNDLDRKAYLDSFSVYGLQWKKIIIESNK